RILRVRHDEGGLCARDSNRLPLLLLWRRLPSFPRPSLNRIRAAEITQRQCAFANVRALQGAWADTRWKENFDDSRIRCYRSYGASVSLTHLHFNVGKAAPACAEVDGDQGGGRPPHAGRAALHPAARTDDVDLQQGGGGGGCRNKGVAPCAAPFRDM